MKNYIKHRITGQILNFKKAPNDGPFYVTIGRSLRQIDGEGQPLLRIEPKPRTSRYTPHVGNKQKMKSTRRMLMDKGASLALMA